MQVNGRRCHYAGKNGAPRLGCMGAGLLNLLVSPDSEVLRLQKFVKPFQRRGCKTFAGSFSLLAVELTRRALLFAIKVLI